MIWWELFNAWYALTHMSTESLTTLKNSVLGIATSQETTNIVKNVGSIATSEDSKNIIKTLGTELTKATTQPQR